MTLPDGWRMVTVGEVADTALGKMLDKGRSSGLPRVRYLRNVNVQWGRVDTHDLFEMELADMERDRFGVEPGDLLVCEGGEIGRCAIWRGDGEYIAFQKALHRVRPNSVLDSTYLRYALELAAESGVLKRYSTGSTIPHLPQQQLRGVPFALPSFSEQRRIVQILEEHLSNLDSGNRNLSDGFKRSERLVSSHLQAAVDGASSSTLGDLAQDGAYGTSVKCVLDGDGPAVIRIPNLIAGKIDLSDEKRAIEGDVDLSAVMVGEGDLLIIRTNGSRSLIGRSAVVAADTRAAFASYLIRYRFDLGSTNPRWVHRALNLPAVRAQIETLAASSAGQYNLSLGKLAGIRLPLPVLSEQNRLVEVAREAEDQVDLLRQTIEAQQRRSAGLRRALLQAAFSGRLTERASDLDRAEELVS